MSERFGTRWRRCNGSDRARINCESCANPAKIVSGIAIFESAITNRFLRDLKSLAKKNQEIEFLGAISSL
jgi:hypothetical protein